MSIQVESMIQEGIRRLTNHHAFTSWRHEEQPVPGDILVINNSFVFRDFKTNKAEEYLCVVVGATPEDDQIGVAVGQRMNNEFKCFSAAAKTPPQLVPLKSAIVSQIEQLGHVVFLLIGQIDDSEIIETKLNHHSFQTVAWDPSISAHALVEAQRIVVKQTNDEEAVWQAIEESFSSAGVEASQALRDAIGVALDKLQERAVAKVIIPSSAAEIQFGITDAILTVLREQRDRYTSAVSKCVAGGAEADAAINDVLRISYNFASDATAFLKLVVSACDLKPILLWGTIAEHQALAAAFNDLPWRRSKHKPSLSGYEDAIADARNSAFHNLFPFRKSLRVALPEAALGAPQLRIFSEYGKRKENQLSYQDKELVEVLLEFTRARERSLPLAFWQKNVHVMNATIALFERTNEFLKLLAACRTA